MRQYGILHNILFSVLCKWYIAQYSLMGYADYILRNVLECVIIKGGDIMAYKDKTQRNAYQNEWIKSKYDRINLTVPAGRKAAIEAAARAAGQSVNGWINGLIDAALSPGGTFDFDGDND